MALIARSAQGSLRDGLSLLDQAIAFGGGAVAEDVVRTMLGTVDREYIHRMADALADGNGQALLAESDMLAARGLASALALEELASLFHRVAVAQVVPTAAAAFDDAERVRGFAARFAPDAVQLMYQIAAQGRADLSVAPDEATGLAMTLLRMLAFAPESAAGDSPAPRRERPASAEPRSNAREGEGTAAGTGASLGAPMTPRSAMPLRAAGSTEGAAAAARPVSVAPAAADPAAPTASREIVALPVDAGAWPAFVAGLKLSGMAAQLAAQTELKAVAGHIVTLALPVAHKHLADKAYADKLKAVLEQATGRKLLLAFEVGAPAESSLAATERRERAEARAKGEAAFREEPFVRELLTKFDGQVKTETVTPIARDASAK